MCFEGDGQLDGVDDLLAHVLRYDEGGDHDDDRRGDEPRTNGKRFDFTIFIYFSLSNPISQYSPDTVDEKEFGEEGGLLRIVNQREDDGVGEPAPGEQAHPHQGVPEEALVDVEYLTGVESVLLVVEDDHVGDGGEDHEEGELGDGSGLQPRSGDAVALGEEQEKEEKGQRARRLEALSWKGS